MVYSTAERNSLRPYPIRLVEESGFEPATYAIVAACLRDSVAPTPIVLIFHTYLP